MPRIDTKVVFHRHSIDPTLKLVSQRKGKVGEDLRAIINEKFRNYEKSALSLRKNTHFGRLTWCMSVDLTNLNIMCSKYTYPLPNIDCMIEGSLCYKMLSFMDTYYGYNQIKMDLVDASKTTFMSNHNNYYYNVVLFRLNNT